MTESVFPSTGVALDRRGLRDRVYELILDMLMRPGLKAGTRLSIDAIARELNVSPTPVREAMVQLERTGLITREALKGYRVSEPISDGQLEALFDARLVLEGGAARMAALQSPEALGRLEAALKAHEEVGKKVLEVARASRDLPVELLREYFAADWNFHHEIFEATSNPFLLDMSEAISTRVHRMRQTLSSGVSDAQEAVAEHSQILEAVRSGNPKTAERAMCSHIEKVRVRSRQLS